MTGVEGVAIPAMSAAVVLGSAALTAAARAEIRAAGARRRLCPAVTPSDERSGRRAVPGPRGPHTGGVWLRRRLTDAGWGHLHVFAPRAWATAIAAGAASGLLLGGLGLGVLGAVLGVASVPAALLAADGRADRRIEAALPETLESVARSMRSGASLRQAVAEAAETAPGPLAPDLGRLTSEVSGGVPLVVALDSWAARRPLPGVRLAVGALALGAEAGGARARAVDGVAETLRARLSIAAEIRAMAAQARLSALVIAVAPVAFAVLTASTDSRTAAFLLHEPLGQACLAAGIGLDLVGALWMQRLCRLEP